MNTNERITLFLESHDSNPRTIKVYRNVLNVFFRFCIENHCVVNTSVPDYLKFIAKLRSENKRQATITLYQSVLKIYFRWLEENQIGANITKGIKVKRGGPEFFKQPLTQDEAKLLLSSIDTTTVKGKRDIAIVKLMLVCALRCIEISRLRVGDVVFDEHEPGLYVLGKGRINREFVPVPESVAKDLTVYIEETQNIDVDDPLFFKSNKFKGERRPLSAAVVGDIVTRRLRAVNLKKRDITPHSLRHTAGSLLACDGMDIYDIQRYMRHTNSRTTEIYIKNVDIQRSKNKKPHMLLNRLLSIESV